MKHDGFLKVADQLGAAVEGKTSTAIMAAEVRVLRDHASWLRQYIENKRVASAARKTFGPSRKPDSEVQPATLARRAARDRKRSVAA